MSGKLLGITVFLLPFTINLATSHAQSWKEWVNNNPTYSQPNPEKSSPSTPGITAPFPETQAPLPPPSQNSLPISTQGLSTHHPFFEQQFLAGCQQTAPQKSYCQCALKEIQNNYTIQEFMTIVEFIQVNGEIPSEIYKVALQCIS